jgi:outer membrane protein assembly factor BamB
VCKKLICLVSFILVLGLVVMVLSLLSVAVAQPEAQQAKQIFEVTGIKGGLIVCVGCGDGQLAASLGASDGYLVHGIDVDAQKVKVTRRHLQSLGLYGRVSVDTFDGKQLPYTDNLVNLLVAEDLGDVPMDEVMRVLCPLGVTYVKNKGKWTMLRKPWPDDIDEWTHFLHDASNNAVAGDTQVAPPRRLKWVCGPLWSRSHEFNSSMCAMVSAKGRLFYIFDEGLTGVTTESIPERWTLIARDAFNGLLLWKRPVPKWGSGQWKNRALRSVPLTVPRRLVAKDERLFMTLGYDAPISVLDAATGEILTTYEGTERTEEIRCIQEILILRKGKNIVMAIDTETGKKLWEVAGQIQPLSLAAQDGKVFYQDGQWLSCLRLSDGEELWRTPSKSPVWLLVVHDDRVFLLRRQELEALSASTGERIWAVYMDANRNELFAVNKQLWHWEGRRSQVVVGNLVFNTDWEGQPIVGRSQETGEMTTRLDTSDVFTPGHHPRCYQSKATENFIITPYRGAEFISVTGAAHTQNDWVRGPCRYGILPCNGLLYAAPHQCFCYPGALLTGFNALAPARESSLDRQESTAEDRLQYGPAYSRIPIPKSPIRNSFDWPTYRHDARRTGATACEVEPEVSEQWRVHLLGRLTPPVVAGHRVYVAAKDEHTLYALHAEDGRKAWQFTAGARIDSPPSVYGELVLFGCTDGCAYCLRASDGELVWRFRAAPSDQRIIAFGHLESPWRVHGSILVKDGVAYCTAGRSTYLDGGLWVFGLDPTTGKVVHETRLDTWTRTRKDAENKPFIPAYHIEGARSDILVSEGDYIYLGQFKFDRTLATQEAPYAMPDPNSKTVVMDLMNQPFVENIESQEKYETVQHGFQYGVYREMMEDYQKMYGAASMGDRNMGLHVLSTGGFLDDSWFNRTFWMYSATWPGYYIAHRGAKTGQLLVVGRERTYAVQSYPSRNLQSPLFTPGEKGYLLFADKNDNEPVLPDYTRGAPKGIGFVRKKPPAWFKWVPVRIRGMVLAGKHLFVAGPPDVVDPKDPMAAFEGRKGAVLHAYSAADGNALAEHKLDVPPVLDGLIAANGQLYLSLESGTVLCMGPDR